MRLLLKVGIGICGATVIIGVGLIIFTFLNKPLLVKISEIVPLSFVDAGELAVNCSLGGQDQARKEVKGGDSIVISCTITNTSKKEYGNLVLQTGIDRPRINYIRELKGATGISSDSTILFTNIVVLAKGKTEVSFIATANYFKDAYALTIKPELKREERTMAIGNEEKLTIEPVNHRPQVRVRKINNERAT